MPFFIYLLLPSARVGDHHLQESWLSFISWASCWVLSAAEAELSQTCLNSGTRSFSLYTCSALCRSLKPTAVQAQHISAHQSLLFQHTIQLNPWSGMRQPAEEASHWCMLLRQE